MKLRYLVVGHKGFIGSQIVRLVRAAGATVVPCDARIDSLDTARRVVFEANCDIVVCAAGLTHTAACATVDALQDPDMFSAVMLANHDVPLWLAEATAPDRWNASGMPMLYIGTGCIYQGQPPGGFTETDEPNFDGSVYSAVKGRTDAQLRAKWPHVLNARIRMPIADEDSPRDFVNKLWTYPKIASVPNSVTVLHEVLPALLALVTAGSAGTFNAVNPEPVTHEAVLAAFADITGHAHKYTLVPQEALDIKAPRSNTVLSAAKLQAALDTTPQSILEAFDAPRQLSSGMAAVQACAARRAPMRLLVTGGLGFIGSHFINTWLKDARVAAVTNVDSVDPCARRDNVYAPSDKWYEHLEWDLSEPGVEDKLAYVMSTRRITHVVHFAAKTHVDTSFDGEQSLAYTYSNVVGTHRLLEAVRRYQRAAGPRFQRLLHMSTDEVYGEVPTGKAHESAVLNPTNPYAATKAAAEFLVKAYGTSFRLPWVMVRCNNVYGPRQHVEKVVPRFVSLLAANKALTLHGDGSSRRMFVHVDDVVEAVMLVARRGKLFDTYNIGASTEISIKDLAALMSRMAGKPECHVEHTPDRPFNDCRYAVDDSKLRALGWSARIPFEAGLAQLLLNK